MSTFFKPQNHPSGVKYPKVFLNITSLGCDFAFMAPSGQDYISVTAKDFFLAKEKVLNYAYAGGEHPCNYSLNKVKNGNRVTLTFNLNSVTSASLGRTYMDYASAIFKQGSPVFRVVLVYSSSGSLLSSSFESLEDMNNNGLITNPSSLEWHSVSDDTSYDYQLPAIKVGNILTPATVNDVVSAQSGILNGIPTKAVRVNTDTIGGVTRVIPLAWFISMVPSQGLVPYITFIMVTSSDKAFDMSPAVGELESWQYKAESSDWEDERCYESKIIGSSNYKKTFEQV